MAVHTHGDLCTVYEPYLMQRLCNNHMVQAMKDNVCVSNCVRRLRPYICQLAAKDDATYIFTSDGQSLIMPIQVLLMLRPRTIGLSPVP